MTDALNTLFGAVLTAVCLGVVIFILGAVAMAFKDEFLPLLAAAATFVAMLFMFALVAGLGLAVIRIALWGFAVL
jgi:hypothetical protein